ncbi:MAG: homocysteine S-methyltransferase family protein [Candidatus Aegiribacteria sp.]|nr:homocysteine S-methyltransferase family protein [Candidatus Aegiribacteria sp.]
MVQAQRLRQLLRERIVFLDGGIGTELMRSGMPVGVSPEEWAAAHPDVLRSIHREYADAHADIVLTCTFGGTAAKLGNPDNVRELNSLLVKIAIDEVGDRVMVAASIGPTGNMIHPSGNMTWKDAYDLFSVQAKALSTAGIDIFFLETFSDPRELKAAVLAVKDSDPDAFISAQMTFGSGGLSLSGTSPTALSLLMNQLPVDATGANCSTGPEELLPVIQEMARFCEKRITVEPNAGLPVDGHYEMNPERFAGWMEDFACSGASIIGGCCGSGPSHVREYTSLLGRRPAKVINTEKFLALTSVDRIVPVGDRMLTAGESINPTGKTQLQKSLSESDFLGVVSLARAQGRADIIDVNLGLERILPEGFVCELFSHLSLGAPLSIDLSDPVNIEKAFSELGGIGILNSLTASEEYILDRVDTLLRHGGYIVLLPIDEDGLGETPSERLSKIEKGISILRKAGFPEDRVIADPIVKPLGTGADAGITLETLTLLKDRGLLTIAGISNISHGLPERSGINAALLSAMAAYGLDIAIIDVLDSMMLEAHTYSQILLGKLEPVERRLPELDAQGISPDFMGILRKNIIIGDRRQTESAGRELLESGVSASEILEKCLASAMEKVGDLYSRRKLFLPHLIAAADASKTLMTLLEPHLTKDGIPEYRGKVILASVRGDIHDIGKNLVALFLRNAGFEVIDLGKDVHATVIAEKAEEIDADIIALSALMSTTAPEMEKVVTVAKERNLKARILIGGAVITEEYAKSISADGYARDAYQAVLEAKRLVPPTNKQHK